jgi:hypothetical protein
MSSPPDRAVAAAAHALAHGDPLRALSAVGLRQDAHALALRGVAMAQLQELASARRLLGRAARALARQGDALGAARARAALAEVTIAQRGRPEEDLSELARELAALGDFGNAAWAELVQARRHVLHGEVEGARAGIERARALAERTESPLVRAVVHLARAEAAFRQTRAAAGAAALEQAARAGAAQHNALLAAEIERMTESFRAPVAKLVRAGGEQMIDVAGLEGVLAPRVLGGRSIVVIDALRRRLISDGRVHADLSRRPVLFALLTALAKVAPAAAPTDVVLREAFGVRRANDSHRARLRVEVGRLRRALEPVCTIEAAPRTLRLCARGTAELVLVLPLEEGDAAALLALLADGEAWSGAALARALGTSARTAQRALAMLCDRGEVRALGRGRARRYARVEVADTIAPQMLLLGLAARA